MDYKLFEIDWSYTEPRLVQNFRKVEVGQIVKVDDEEGKAKKFRIVGFTSEESWVEEWKTWAAANSNAVAAQENGSIMEEGVIVLPFSPTTCNQFGNHTYAIGRLEV